jgi:Fe-S-cluster-containing dehydrogenase component
MDAGVGVMKKCTLCVDRIYGDGATAADRLPACVAACPTGARHFGDLADAESSVSKLVAGRGGYDLMPELGYRPTNKYLPPRPGREAHGEPGARKLESAAAGGFLGGIDRMLDAL